MENSDKRRQERYDSLNLLSYVCLDADGKEWKQGMGRTLNISETGLKLETHEPIETQYVVLLSIGFGDDVIDIKGQVVYCNRGENSGRFESGIQFEDIDPESMAMLRQFIHAFENQ